MRPVHAMLLLALAASAHAQAPLSTSLKKAMLDTPDRVPVVVHWKRGAAHHELPGARSLPLFGCAAVSLPAAQIEELATSPAVLEILHDQPMALEPPRIPRTVDELAAQEARDRATWGLAALDVPRVHQMGITGKGVRVGIVDSGIDGLHPFFRDKLAGFADFTGFLSPEPDDADGHGSHVAGTIAGGQTPDGIQVGVAPGVTLVIARTIGPRQGSLSMILSGLAYCADPDGDPATDDGARVVNLSLGGNNPAADGLWNDVLAFLASRNVLAVVAAGNEGEQGPGSVSSPAYLDGAFAVGAVAPDRTRPAFSSFSPATLGNRPRSFAKPDVAAPGVAVLSTREKNVIGRMDGTSMAAPHVTGVAALVLEANPKLTAREVRDVIEETATDLGETGRDAEFGAGLVNAYRAVLKAKELATSPARAKSVDELLTEGQRLMVGNNLPAALARFMQVIGRGDFTDPKTQAAAYSIGQAYFRQGNFRGALAGFAKLAQIAPRSEFGAKSVFQIAKCYKETPVASSAETILTFTKAAEGFQRFLDAYPEHDWAPLAMVELANCLASLNQPDQARGVLQAFGQRFGNRPEAAQAAELWQRLEHGTSDPLAP